MWKPMPCHDVMAFWDGENASCVVGLVGSVVRSVLRVSAVILLQTVVVVVVVVVSPYLWL